MTRLVHRPLATLPETRLPWLALRDHFVATVGVHAGQGRPLGPLLVLADATFAPRWRFPLHPHRDMEILSIVVDGVLSHHGDQAHGATLGPRSAQLISARDGIVHAEGNDTDQPTRMLQLWFTPRSAGGTPAYFSRQLSGQGRELVAGDDAMPLRADAQVSWLSLAPATPLPLPVAPGRLAYLLALTGPVQLEEDGHSPLLLAPGDGAVAAASTYRLTAAAPTSALWIELPATPAQDDRR